MDNRTLAHRLEIARRVKRESCGGREVTNEDLGEAVQAAPKNGRFSRAMLSAGKSKAKNGGIIGVSKNSGVRPKPSFVASVYLDGFQSKMVFACAISAMRHRNTMAERRWPGIEAFQCDENAVWERWGCSCGKHERGKA